MSDLKYVKGDRYYGNTAARYQKKREKQPWWSVEQTEMKDLLTKLPDNLNVVDIPFGTGRFVNYYLEKGYKVHGLDASDEIMAQAAVELGDAYKQCETFRGFSTELPFNDNQFDLLVSTRFLHSIILFGDVKKTMSEFARVTSKYAIIQLGVAKVPNGDYPKDDERMGGRMSMEETEAFLGEYGFKVTDRRLVLDDDPINELIYHFLCTVE